MRQNYQPHPEPPPSPSLSPSLGPSLSHIRSSSLSPSLSPALSSRSTPPPFYRTRLSEPAPTARQQQPDLMWHDVMAELVRRGQLTTAVDVLEQAVADGTQFEPLSPLSLSERPSSTATSADPPTTVAVRSLFAALQKAGGPAEQDNWQREGRHLLGLASRALDAVAAAGWRDPLPFTCLITMLQRACRSHELLSLVERMRALDVPLDAYTLTTALGAAMRVADVVAAEAIWAEMTAASHAAGAAASAAADAAPSAVAFTMMMSLYGRAGRLDDALRMFREMKAAGVAPDGKAYSTLIGSLARALRADDVEELVREMTEGTSASPAASGAAGSGASPSQRVPPSVYTSLVSMYGRLGRLDDMARVLRDMRARKAQAEQSLFVEACKRQRNFQEAARVYERMRAAGVKPQQQTLSLAMEVMGELGNVQGAERALEEAEAAGTPVDIVCFNTLLNVYAKAGQSSRAQAVFTRMQAAGVTPNTRSHTVLLKALSKDGRGKEAVAAFRAMERGGCHLDEIAYNTVINACGNDLPVDETLRLLRAMRRSGYRPNLVTRNLVLSLLVKAGRTADASELFEEARAAGEEDAFMYCTMAHAFGRRRELDRMEGVLGDAAARRMVSLPLLNACMDAYGKAGLLANMETCLARIRSFDFVPNHTSFNIVIHAYGMAGMIPEMEDALARMRRSGLRPDVYSYNILIGAYGDAGMPWASVSMVQHMHAEGLLPDQVTYQNLVSAFERAGDFLEAARWSLWMKQAGFSPSGKSCPHTFTLSFPL
ncbi:unnamed protein product [Closterium sp. Yama58-4]|nr:unnamed protein product [Closterium sp. Yama58-4]